MTMPDLPTGSYDPLAPMIGFRARRRLAVPTTDRSAEAPIVVQPPFGTMKGRRVGYKVNLTHELDTNLRSFIARAAHRLSLGDVAVEAIRQVWREIDRGLDGERSQPDFALRRQPEGRLRTTAEARTVMFYVSVDEAHTIEQIRRSMGRMEIGQLHRLALKRYLA